MSGPSFLLAAGAEKAYHWQVNHSLCFYLEILLKGTAQCFTTMSNALLKKFRRGSSTKQNLRGISYPPFSFPRPDNHMLPCCSVTMLFPG